MRHPDFGFPLEGVADSVFLLQCCHRVKDKAFINAFNEANSMLREGGVLLVSLPEDFTTTLGFPEQIQDFGFELKRRGTLFTRSLSVEELSSMGVDDPARLKAKVEQATRLFMFVKMRPAEGSELDRFRRASSSSGKGEFTPSLDEVTTPDAVLESMSHAFQEMTTGFGEAFLLTGENLPFAG